MAAEQLQDDVARVERRRRRCRREVDAGIDVVGGGRPDARSREADERTFLGLVGVTVARRRVIATKPQWGSRPACHVQRAVRRAVGVGAFFDVEDRGLRGSPGIPKAVCRKRGERRPRPAEFQVAAARVAGGNRAVLDRRVDGHGAVDAAADRRHLGDAPGERVSRVVEGDVVTHVDAAGGRGAVRGREDAGAVEVPPGARVTRGVRRGGPGVQVAARRLHVKFSPSHLLTFPCSNYIFHLIHSLILGNSRINDFV